MDIFRHELKFRLGNEKEQSQTALCFVEAGWLMAMDGEH